MVYYLDEIEKRKLFNDILPKVRNNIVSEELRGWNWNKSPLLPYSDSILLPVWEVSSLFCETFRDTYIRHKLIKKPIPPTKEMFFGILLHKYVQTLFSFAKKYIYLGEYNDLINIFNKELDKIIESVLKQYKKTIDILKFNEKEIELLKKYMIYLGNWEINRISNKVYEFLSNHPYSNEEAIVLNAIPIFTEINLDGYLLGLSRNLKVDAVNIFDLILFDIKFSKSKLLDHKLQIAGYSLVFESIYGRPIDIGVVVYIKGFKNKIPIIERDIFIISDYYRNKFIELRDYKQKILLDDEIPQKSLKNCNKCIFKKLGYC